MLQLKQARGVSKYLLLASIGLLAISAESGIVSSQEKQPPSTWRSELGLFSGQLAVLSQNRVWCAINTAGSICEQFFNAPIGEGGIWPVGTWNGYIFASGLQIAGINSPVAGPWASDTVGAFAFHPIGWGNMTPLTEIFDSTNPDDLALWPEEAVIADDGLYHSSHIGRATISDQDTWVLYWDGNPSRLALRQHPMGVEITQRTHAWNYPNGNADILYFVFELRNVTHEPDFQLPNELEFFAGEDVLPDEGWTIEEMHLGYHADHDVADAGSNFTTAVFPFDLVLSYQGGFSAPRFEYTPDIFYPPFVVDAPGFTGAALVKTPVGGDGRRGMTLATGFLGAGPPGQYPQTGNTVRLWGTLSGKTVAPSSVAPQVETGEPATTERSTGLFFQSPHDARVTAATGPFRLAAGESTTLVLALVFAATVETMPDGTPSGIIANASAEMNPPGTPSFHSGFASARGCDPAGLNCSNMRPAAANQVKTIERGAGWVSYHGPAPSGRSSGALEGPENRLPLFDAAGQSNFDLVPGSLLWKALVAHDFVEGGFGPLPAPPEAPSFDLVAGNGRVTVNWKPSPTDENGDPFWEAASDTLSPFYNPNYRRSDVQLYRVWRQTIGENEFSIVATFTVPDRPFLDYTCETVEPQEEAGTKHVLPSGDTVEVRGYAAGEICTLAASPIARDDSVVFNNGGAGQNPGGGVTRDINLEPVPLRLDTAGVESELEVLYSWTDRQVTNNFTYQYAVTAVDLNSASSGPVSQESHPAPQHVVPRSAAGAGKQVHTVPDPYLAGSQYDLSPLYRQLMFVNLPPRATVRIYSLGGRLIRQLEHDDPDGGGRLAWDMRDQINYHVSSGVYFFHVATPEGDERVGKFTVVMGTTWP